MRIASGILLVAFSAYAQFRSTAPLVVAPTSVTDTKGRFVDGLTEKDLVLYDNNVIQPLQLEYSPYPISLVVAVESNLNSEPVMHKLDGSGILFSQLLAADQGETALISFCDAVELHSGFTSNPDRLTRALKGLRVEGDGAAILDGVTYALKMLAGRKPERRHIVFVIGEKRDRSSKAKLPEVMAEIQRQNAAIYWLTYSTLLTPFTEEPKRTKTNDRTNGTALPPDVFPLDPLSSIIVGIKELAHLTTPDLSDLFTKATGGRTMSFLKKNGLEDEIQAIANEIHRQYILTFQPRHSEPGQFHSLRVEVKDRPDLKAATRAGYWAVE
jgi:VWFA-related protein